MICPTHILVAFRLSQDSIQLFVLLQAAIMATCKPGDHILVARNCHSSVISGLILTGALYTGFAPRSPQFARLLALVHDSRCFQKLYGCLLSKRSHAGCNPIWIPPQYDSSCQVATCLDPVVLQGRLKELHASGNFPKAAIAVSPTYYGTCSDIRGKPTQARADIPQTRSEAVHEQQC